MKKVYILYGYDEHGPEDLVVTDDVRKVPEMVTNWAQASKYDEALIAKLVDAASHAKDGVNRLERGWGGATLHIVDLL